MDEFSALLNARNASWSCAPGPFGNTTVSTLKLASAAPGNSTDDAALVLTYLAGRLSASNATLAWGSALLSMPDLFGDSCDEAFANRSTAPYFSVLQAELLGNISGVGDRGVALALELAPAKAMQMFSRITMATQLIGNSTLAHERFPNASTAPPMPGLRELVPNPDPTVATANQLKMSRTLATFNWNYGGSFGRAAVSPLAIVSGVPTSQLGCTTCYVYLDVSVYGSLDYCSPTGTASCWVTSAGKYVYLRQVGAYVEGIADARGTFKLNNPTLSGSSTTTLMAKTKVGSFTLLLAGLPMVINCYFGVDAIVSVDSGSIQGTMEYSASYYQRAIFGATYNYVKNNNNQMYTISQYDPPTTSVPPVDFSGVKGSVILSLVLQPKVSLALWDIVSVYFTIDPKVTLRAELNTNVFPNCNPGVGLSLKLGATAQVGMDAITWESILASVSLSSTLGYALYGTVVAGVRSNPLTIISPFDLISQTCIAAALPSPSNTPTASQTSAGGGGGGGPSASSTPAAQGASGGGGGGEASASCTPSASPTPAASCPAGQHAAATGDDYNQGPLSCTACPAGSFCAGGATEPAPCLAGTFSSAGAQVCQYCPEGKWSGPSASACNSCSSGTFCPVGSSSGTPTVTLEGTYSVRSASGTDGVFNIRNTPNGAMLQAGVSVNLQPRNGWGGDENELFVFSPQPGGWHTVSALGQVLDVTLYLNLVMNPPHGQGGQFVVSPTSQQWYLQPGDVSGQYYITNVWGDAVPATTGDLGISLRPRLGNSWRSSSMLWRLSRASNSPTPTGSITPSASSSPSSSGTTEASPTPSPSSSDSPSQTSTPSPTLTPTGTTAPTPEAKLSQTSTPTLSSTQAGAPAPSSATGSSVAPTATPSSTPSLTSTSTLSATPTPSKTATRTPSTTPSVGASVTRSPSAPRTPSQSPTPTPSGTATASRTPSGTPSGTPALTPGASASATPSVSPSATPTPSSTPPRTRSRTPTRTPTPAVTPGFSPSATSTESAYPSASMSNLPSSSNSPTPSTTPLPSGAPVSASPSPTASSSPVVAGGTLAVTLSLPMPAATGADALAAMLGLITTAWLGLPAATPGSITTFYDASTFPPAPQGFTFTLMLPLATAQGLVASYASSTQGSGAFNLRVLQADAAAAPSAASALAVQLSATVAAMSSDGSLTTAVASSGLAPSLGYDSSESLMAGLVVPPVAVAEVASASPSPWPSGGAANLTAQLTLAGLPPAAFDTSTGLLLATSVASLSSALAAAAASTACPTCSATILALVDAARPQVAYFVLGASAAGGNLRSLQSLQPLPLPQGGLLLSYRMSGPASAIAKLAAAGLPPAFAAALAASVQGATGWGVSVALIPAAAAASAEGSSAAGPSILVAAVGGAVGGLVVVLLLVAGYFVCARSRSKVHGAVSKDAGATMAQSNNAPSNDPVMPESSNPEPRATV